MPAGEEIGRHNSARDASVASPPRGPSPCCALDRGACKLLPSTSRRPQLSASAMKPLLFSPISIKDVTFKNRVVIAPMATYAAIDGIAQDFHFAHWGRLVLGGAALRFCGGHRGHRAGPHHQRRSRAVVGGARACAEAHCHLHEGARRRARNSDRARRAQGVHATALARQRRADARGPGARATRPGTSWRRPPSRWRRPHRAAPAFRLPTWRA